MPENEELNKRDHYNSESLLPENERARVHTHARARTFSGGKELEHAHRPRVRHGGLVTPKLRIPVRGESVVREVLLERWISI